MALTIRDSLDSDIAAITAIYADAVRDGTASFELKAPDEAEMAARRARLIAVGYPYLVGEIGGRVAGYAYAGPYRARPAYRWAVEDSVYVDAAHHRRGLARALLAELIARCERRGLRQMIAIIGDSANTASVELHRDLGFALTGTLKDVGYKHGRWLDTVIMQRALGAGAETAPE